jgi:hypothetical protein
VRSASIHASDSLAARPFLVQPVASGGGDLSVHQGQTRADGQPRGPEVACSEAPCDKAMKRPNRTISILSMSALDVLAMATGVFVLLLVMLMPYYRKTMDAEAEIEAARVAAAEAHVEVQSLKNAAAQYRAEAGTTTAAAAELDARAAALDQAARQKTAPKPAAREGPIPDIR